MTSKLFLIIFLGLALRLININQSFWLDEAINALAIKNNSLLELIFNFAPGDFHPPLYYLLLKLWSGIFGYSEIALRFPSIVFSLGTGVFIYLLGKKKLGLIAMFLWMINPLAIYYAQEARMYSLAAFALAGAVYFFLQKKWLWYFIFFFVAIGSDYLPVLMFPVFFLLSDKKKKFIIDNLSFIIIFLLWSPIFFQQLQAGFAASSSSWATILGKFDLKALALIPVKFAIGRISTPNKWLYALIIIPIVIEYLATILKARSKILWLWFAVPIFLALLISIFVPIFSYFRLFFVLPAFILLIPIGIGRKHWKIVFFAVVSLVSLAIFNVNTEFHRENWRAAASYIQSDPGIVVFPNTAQSAPLDYYGTSLDNPNKNTVYLMRYVQEIFDPTDSLRASLETRDYKKIEEKGFNGILIWKYKKQL